MPKFSLSLETMLINSRLLPLLLALVIFLCQSLLGQEKTHFVLDPGHGGKDPGCQHDGVDEKILTLDLAKRIQKIMVEKGYPITLTRDSNVFLSLLERAQIANKIPNSVFVSLHFNGHSDRSVRGIETFYWPGSVKSQKLASTIQGELARRIATRDRGFKPEQLGVLRATKGVAALVECGFLSNRWERQRCVADWFKQVLAEEISQALIRHDQLTNKATPKE